MFLFRLLLTSKSSFPCKNYLFYWAWIICNFWEGLRLRFYFISCILWYFLNIHWFLLCNNILSNRNLWFLNNNLYRFVNLFLIFTLSFFLFIEFLSFLILALVFILLRLLYLLLVYFSWLLRISGSNWWSHRWYSWRRAHLLIHWQIWKCWHISSNCIYRWLTIILNYG